MNSDNLQLINLERPLRAGCYDLHFVPNHPYWGEDDPPSDRERGIREYAGTLRVVHYNNDGTRAYTPRETEKGKRGNVVEISGDLYALPPDSIACACGEAKIPIFPIGDYRFYLLATAIQDGDNGEFILDLSSYEFSNGGWKDAIGVKAFLKWSKAPDGSRSAFDYLEGRISDENGNEIGTMTLNWISDYLRNAVLEIDRVNDVLAPLNNFAGVDTDLVNKVEPVKWKDIFEVCGWCMDPRLSDQPAVAASKIWSEPELQESMPQLLDSFDLDREWRYHIFCVGRLTDGSRGYEFEAEGGEIGNGLFESVVLAAKCVFRGSASDDKEWGALAGRTLDETPGYFRTAAHEVGHALNLDHNFRSPGFMMTTDAIREIAAKKNPGGSPDVLSAIQWRFDDDDLKRLRHWPDIVVRPGTKPRPKFQLPGIDGFKFVSLLGGAADDLPESELQFGVKPYELDHVPLGAPVRVELTLSNAGDNLRNVPRLRLKEGNIGGRATDQSKNERSFAPLAGPNDQLGMQNLAAKQSIKGCLTLMRGPDGALFPEPGPYTVTVDLDLQVYGQGILSNSTKVWVDPFLDDRHRRVATLLLQSKAALVNFVIGDGLPEGNQAINLALNNPILGPHYAVVALKRLCRQAGRVSGSLDQALLILGKGQPLLTDSEIADSLKKSHPRLTKTKIAEMLKNREPNKITPEIAALVKKRQAILTDCEMASLVRIVRASLEVPAVEDDNSSFGSSASHSGGPKSANPPTPGSVPTPPNPPTPSSVSTPPNPPTPSSVSTPPNPPTPYSGFALTYALEADLKYIGTRIVLGNPSDNTLNLFLQAIEVGIKGLPGSSRIGSGKNLNPTETEKVLRELLEQKLGLSATDSNEFSELLLAHDNNVFKSLQTYSQEPIPENKEKIGRAFAEVGFSPDDLYRIAKWLRGVIRSNPALLSESMLWAGKKLIVEKLQGVKFNDPLHAAFCQDLATNIEEALKAR